MRYPDPIDPVEEIETPNRLFLVLATAAAVVLVLTVILGLAADGTPAPSDSPSDAPSGEQANPCGSEDRACNEWLDIQESDTKPDQRPGVPQLTIIDQTGDRWPQVRRAVTAWNRSDLVEIVLSEEPVPGTFNVRVQAFDYSATWLGLTNYTSAGSALIQLNTGEEHAAYLDRDHKTATVAHEIGHVLGIEHPLKDAPKGTKGVIAGTPGAPGATLPTKADFAALEAASTEENGVGVFAFARYVWNWGGEVA